MDTGKRQKILIVDDITENIKILINIFKENVKTHFAKNGETAIELAKKIQPDIILLDIIMPGKDGYQVCRELKAIEETKDIPIIFITAKTEIEDETMGLDLGAVDYITKPFNTAIIKSRVNTHLRLSEATQRLKTLYGMALDSNPLTGLPGNNSIMKRIEEVLSKKENVGVIYADLDNFKAYNDKYGFANGDKIILFAEKILQDVSSSLSLENTFLGHIGGDDFVLIIPSDAMENTAEEIIKEFDKGIKAFYNKEDIERGFIYSYNRQGKKEFYGLVSISLAGVDLKDTGLKNYLEVNDACSTTKKKAKTIQGSSYFKDRRKY